jgi:amidophosphoribosyltransferase
MCGFVGLVADNDVAPEVHIALQALQHRGQDSAGIATMNTSGSQFFVRRGLGTVPQALGPDDLAALTGPIGIGHVRYPTIGRGVLGDAQPFFYRQPGVLMAHNGNVTNFDELQRSLADRSIHLLSRCDVEPALCEFADALMTQRSSKHTIEDALYALRQVRARVRGAYSIVAALMLDGEPTLVVFRDPNGIRPAVIGKRTTDNGHAWIAASESVALDALGFERLEEPAPGEALFLRANQPAIRRPMESEERAPCVFEFIYFARPDSVIGGREVYETRMKLGVALGDRVRGKGIDADVVIPVPDTARPAATAMAETLQIPVREGLIKNRYSGRTFIMPDALSRTRALRLKLNPLPREIEGRRVLLVDDSIVRGTTLHRVIRLLRDAGATEVHLAIHAPPVRNPCFYGIDMSTEEELFARRFSDDLDTLEVEAAAALGAESLTYLPVSALDAAFDGPRCAACFDGAYVQPLGEADRAGIRGDRAERASQLPIGDGASTV